MNRASTTHLHMLTHKCTSTHAHAAGGWLRECEPRPAVHTGMCLTAVTDSPNDAEEKTHINTRRLRRDRNTHSDMSSALCAPDFWKDTCVYAKVHKCTYSFRSVAQACIWYISNKSNGSKVKFSVPHKLFCGNKWGCNNMSRLMISALRSNILQVRPVLLPILCLIIDMANN